MAGVGSLALLRDDRIFYSRLLKFPGAEFVLVEAEIYALTGERHAFKFEAEALLEGGVEAEFDFAAGA